MLAIQYLLLKIMINMKSYKNLDFDSFFKTYIDGKFNNFYDFQASKWYNSVKLQDKTYNKKWMHNIIKHYGIEWFKEDFTLHDFINYIANNYSDYNDFVYTEDGKANNTKDYILACKKGWIKDVKTFFEKDTLKNLLKKIKNKYKTFDEFLYTEEYHIALSNKWLTKVKKECFKGQIKRIPASYWTFDTCFEIAKQCTTRREFAWNYSKAYAVAKRNFYDKERGIRWIDVMIPLPNKENKVGNVYYYLFENIEVDGKIGAVYVGITINPLVRDYNHRTSERSSVYRFAKEHNTEVPKMKILAEKVSVERSTELEGEYVRKFSERYYIINQAKCGKGSSSVGYYGMGKLAVYSYDELLKIVKEKYKTYGDFIGSKNEWTDEYRKAYNNCWVRKICNDCNFKKGHNFYTNIDEFIKDVQSKYVNYEDFRYKDNKRHNSNEWVTALRHSDEDWLLKTVEKLWPKKLEATKDFIKQSKNKCTVSRKTA